MKKNTINYVVTSFLIPFVLSAQMFYNILIINKIKNPLTIIGLIIVTIYIFIKFNGYSLPLCNNKLASPVWGNSEIKLWEFILFSVIIFYPNFKHIYVLNLLLLFLTHVFVGGAYGSMWCAITTPIAFKYLIEY